MYVHIGFSECLLSCVQLPPPFPQPHYAPDECYPSGGNETIALVAGPLSLFGPRRPSPQAGPRTPAGTAHACLFESGLVIIIAGGHCSRRSTAWTWWCRRVERSHIEQGPTTVPVFSSLSHNAVAVNTGRLKCRDSASPARLAYLARACCCLRVGSRNLDSSCLEHGPTSSGHRGGR
jgi:hypothetical protein